MSLLFHMTEHADLVVVEEDGSSPSSHSAWFRNPNQLSPWESSDELEDEVTKDGQGNWNKLPDTVSVFGNESRSGRLGRKSETSSRDGSRSSPFQAPSKLESHLLSLACTPDNRLLLSRIRRLDVS